MLCVVERVPNEVKDEISALIQAFVEKNVE